jgi:hypothetical protein
LGAKSSNESNTEQKEMTVSPMDRAKRNRWSEQIAQQIARDCLRWAENGAFLDIQRAAAIVRAGQALKPKDPEVLDVVGRLRAWIRDYGHEKQPVFIADLKMVLDVISTEE